MNNNQSSRFLDGFVLGVIIGALGVFLFGTKSGKNLMKIVSEQGLEGIANLMEEYNLTSLDEESFEDEAPEAVEKVKTETGKEDHSHNGEEKQVREEAEQRAPKKRFFKRFRN
ncbi:MAG: YtxH domain-containing protein [Candidatus Levybacteria bacterium]|nr:YtxH domain-containing protein [Candidatus Levybacteria bacterium]